MPPDTTTATADATASRIADEVERLPGTGQRKLVAVAGPPASGKSTVARSLSEELTVRGHPTGLVAMDGFHLDNAILDARGLRARKGAPETFDLGGFQSLIKRLEKGGEVIAPTFDRSRDISIGSSAVIAPDMSTVVIEGNYLLLDEPGWKDLRIHWSYAVFLSPALEVLQARLMERWRSHGFDEATARQKTEANDLPNAERILKAIAPHDLRL